MKYSAKHYAQSLFEVLKQTDSAALDNVLQKFAELLKKNGALPLYPQIERHLEDLLLGDQGIARAQLTTARNLKLDQKTLVLISKIVGKELKIEHNVDENLVGGLVVRVGDLLIDASLKRKLSDLQHSLES